MSVVAAKTQAVAQLFRVKPVLSWAVSAFLLGAALAYAEAGTAVNQYHGVLAIVGVLLAQGIVSHGLNDAYDWLTGTDKESIGKGTGGSRVIPEGKMTVAGTVAAALLGLVGVIAIGVYFYQQYGAPILVLLAVAIWSPVAYSVPPLKLGYRPFSELFVVLPALVGVVVGTELVLTGDASLLSGVVGFAYAMLCISWFIVSRVPDYKPDKSVGKVTTVVYFGRRRAKFVSLVYLLAGVCAGVYLVTEYGWAFMPMVAAGPLLGAHLGRLDPFSAYSASSVRLWMMHTTTLVAIATALSVVLVGV
jgi:1,4-dihydroxy-2-naphthoate octaprenyltransferase